MILEILEETYSFREDWPNLCRIYQKQAEQSETPEEKTIIYGTLGEIYEEKLHQVDDAIYWYRRPPLNPRPSCHSSKIAGAVCRER